MKVIPEMGRAQCTLKVIFIITKNLKHCMYSGTCLSQTSLRPAFVFGIDRCSFVQVKLTKISYIGTLLKVWFIQDSSLFRVQFS